jgi:hypothetical protein
MIMMVSEEVMDGIINIGMYRGANRGKRSGCIGS